MKSAVVALMLASVAFASAAADAPLERDRYVNRLGELVNRYRAEHGGTSLALDASLSAIAREQAAKMAKEGRLSHDGFQQRFTRARSPHCVENVAAAGTPQATFDAWRDSPTHAHNLLDPEISRMGMGIDGRYVAFFACR